MAPGTELDFDTPEGAEILVLEGELLEGRDILNRGSWLRTPVKTSLKLHSNKSAASFWMKLGGLGQVDQQIVNISVHI